MTWCGSAEVHHYLDVASLPNHHSCLSSSQRSSSSSSSSSISSRAGFIRSSLHLGDESAIRTFPHSLDHQQYPSKQCQSARKEKKKTIPHKFLPQFHQFLNPNTHSQALKPILYPLHLSHNHFRDPPPTLTLFSTIFWDFLSSITFSQLFLPLLKFYYTPLTNLSCFCDPPPIPDTHCPFSPIFHYFHPSLPIFTHSNYIRSFLTLLTHSTLLFDIPSDRVLLQLLSTIFTHFQVFSIFFLHL